MNGPVPTRTLRDYLASLPAGSSAGVVGNNLVIRTDLATQNQTVPSGGLTSQVLGKLSNISLDVGWVNAGAGDMLKSVYDPQNKNADAFARANQTGTQPATTITGLATVATTGAYADLSGAPSFLPPRMTTVATTATLTPNAATQDATAITAQAGALTVAAPTNMPVNGQSLIIRIRDNGTTRAITWNAAYTAFNPTDLRTATVVGKTLLFQFIYNQTESEWQLLHSNASFGLWS